MGCATVAEEVEFRNPVVTIRNVHGSQGGTASIEMDVFNPDRYKLDVRRMRYWVTRDSTRLAEDSLVTPFIIAARSSAHVTAPLPMPVQQIAQQARAVAGGTGADSASYHITGTMTVNTHLGGFTLPFGERLTLSSSP
jgi:hypothetical protein